MHSEIIEVMLAAVHGPDPGQCRYGIDPWARDPVKAFLIPIRKEIQEQEKWQGVRPVRRHEAEYRRRKGHFLFLLEEWAPASSLRSWEELLMAFTMVVRDLVGPFIIGLERFVIAQAVTENWPIGHRFDAMPMRASPHF